MRFNIFYLFFFISILYSHNIESDPEWKRYHRGSFIVNEEHNYGFGGYLRLKRTTDYTFRDLRIYIHLIENNTYQKIRYKNSRKFLDLKNMYNYTTIAIDQNTKIGVNVRYHGNQGFGYFLKKNKNAHLNTEIGIAYDVSDYLNDSSKTSYFKTGVYWDQDFDSYEIKLEIEDYIQITDINLEDLSRMEISLELFFQIKKDFNIILGYEYEDFKNSKNNINSSVYLSIERVKTFNFNKLKNKLFLLSRFVPKPK